MDRGDDRLTYAQQQVDWFYTDLLIAQHRLHTSCSRDGICFWTNRILRCERALAAAHEQLLKLCSDLGPATLSTWRDCDSGTYSYEVRDAAGFIRALDGGSPTRTGAALLGAIAAFDLGFEIPT